MRSLLDELHGLIAFRRSSTYLAQGSDPLSDPRLLSLDKTYHKRYAYRGFSFFIFIYYLIKLGLKDHFLGPVTVDTTYSGKRRYLPRITPTTLIDGCVVNTTGFSPQHRSTQRHFTAKDGYYKWKFRTISKDESCTPIPITVVNK